MGTRLLLSRGTRRPSCTASSLKDAPLVAILRGRKKKARLLAGPDWCLTSAPLPARAHLLVFALTLRCRAGTIAGVPATGGLGRRVIRDLAAPDRRLRLLLGGTDPDSLWLG